MGGAPRSLAFLIENLDSHQFRPIVLMPKRPGNDSVKDLFINAGAVVVEERHIRPFGGVNGFRCQTIKERMFALLAAIPTLIKVRKHVKNLLPDLVHVNTSVLPFAAAGTALSGHAIPRIIHVRETLLTNWWGKLLGWLNRQFATHFIGIDHHGLEKIGAVGDRSTVVRNFVDRQRFSPLAGDRDYFRNQLNISPGDVLFTCMSRIAPSNGCLELAEFLARHQAKLPSNAKFLICGFHDAAGSDSTYARRTMEAISKSSNTHSLQFTDRIIDLIAASDVIIAPFRTSHSARMVIEGAAMGKPCMVTDLPNLREQTLADKTGMVFHFDHPDEFIEKLALLTQNDSLRQQMGIESSQFAAEHYDNKKNSLRVVDIYNQILSNQK